MNDNLSIKHPRLLVAAACLLISFFLYAFYRSEHTILNLLLSHTFPHHLYQTLRSYTLHLLPLPDALTWRIPAGFWILGSSLLTDDCSLHIGSWQLRLAWLPPTIALLIELAQFFQLTDGSFDPWDILTIAIAASIAAWSTNHLPSTAFPKPWNWLLATTCLIILFLADTKP